MDMIGSAFAAVSTVTAPSVTEAAEADVFAVDTSLVAAAFTNVFAAEAYSSFVTPKETPLEKVVAVVVDDDDVTAAAKVAAVTLTLDVSTANAEMDVAFVVVVVDVVAAVVAVVVVAATVAAVALTL